MASVVATAGGKALQSLLIVMIAFYVTCIIFIVCILGLVLWLSARISIFKLLKYLGKEYLLIVATASSETALPALLKKMEHLGVSKGTVGITVPTGYSFNLDGTAIYLTMSSLFIADALNKPMQLGEQIALLVFMMIASKGAGAVAGAGLASLSAGLQSHRPDLLNGVGLIVGIDRFMAEARSLTNFSGNAVACVVIASWVKELNHGQMHRVLAGKDPYIPTTDEDDHDPEGH
jgi:aerobic C4-dicarboxylate transport protein